MKKKKLKKKKKKIISIFNYIYIFDKLSFLGFKLRDLYTNLYFS